MGADGVALVVARRHHGRHRELRLLSVPRASGRCPVATADAQPRGGHAPRDAVGGHGLRRRRLRRLRHDARAERARGQRCVAGRPLGRPPIRARRRRGRACGDCRRGRGDGGARARRDQRGRGRLQLVAARHARDARRQAGAVEPRRSRRTGRARRARSRSSRTARSSSSRARTSTGTRSTTAS